MDAAVCVFDPQPGCSSTA